MAEQHEKRTDGMEARAKSDGPDQHEPELADLISAWCEAARARLLARRRGLFPPRPRPEGSARPSADPPSGH